MLSSNNLKRVKLELNSANESKTILQEDDPCVNTFSGTPNQVEVTKVGNNYTLSANTLSTSLNSLSIYTVSNIDTNISNIGINAANIATNAGNIATNTTGIQTNADDIYDHDQTLAQHTSNISSLSAYVATNISNITTNQANIATNTTNIGTKVSKSGDTMTGTLDMGNNSITNVATIENTSPSVLEIKSSPGVSVDSDLDLNGNDLLDLGELDFTGPQLTLRSSTNHGYLQFYNTKQVPRSAYFGFGSGGNNTFTLNNEISGGGISVICGGAITLNPTLGVSISNAGSASTPAIAIADNNTGLYAKAANKLTLCAAGGDFLTIDGVTSPFGIDFHNRYIRNLAGGSQSLTFSGPWATNQTVTISWKIYDGNVILNVPYMITTGTSSSASLISTTSLPSSIRPTSISYCHAVVKRNSVDSIGTLSIDTGGIIRIAPINASFAGSGVEGVFNSSYTYKL